MLKSSDVPLRRSKRLREQVDKKSSLKISKVQISEAAPQEISLAKDETILKPEKYLGNGASNQSEMTDMEDSKSDFKSLDKSDMTALSEKKSRIDTLAQGNETDLPEEVLEIHKSSFIKYTHQNPTGKTSDSLTSDGTDQENRQSDSLETIKAVTRLQTEI